jgi:hypothetical protein
MKKSVFNLLLFVLAIISIPYIILFLMYIFVNIFETVTPQYNPKERNYLTFPNGNTDEIIDSLNSFKIMVKTMDLPRHCEFNYTSFRYIKFNFEIENCEFGILNFNNLRTAECLSHLRDDQIIDFLKLYKYLFYQNITPGKYFYDGCWFIFRYKQYYYMYDDLNYDGDLDRTIVLADSKDELDLENFKILDSYKNLYLYTFKDSKIRSDDVKYKILPKFRIE